MSELNLTLYPTGCVCNSLAGLESGDAGCVGSDDERMLRARLYRMLTTPLSAPERKRLAQDVDTCFKGERTYAELIQLDDVDLCQATLESWASMARKNGLI